MGEKVFSAFPTSTSMATTCESLRLLLRKL